MIRNHLLEKSLIEREGTDRMYKQAVVKGCTNRKKTRNVSNTWLEIKKNKSIYLYISPFYILFLIFGLFPILYSIVLSFQKWDGISEPQFVGLSQFQMMLKDIDFWKSILNTFIIWFESTVPMLVFALIIAFLINSKFIKGREVYRVLYFLPNVTSVVAVAIVFATLFGNKYGLLNYFLTKLGLSPIEWLKVPKWLQVAISSMVVWRWTGYNAIIYLAGLQKIPTNLYEAAKIDGATGVQTFFKITIPLLNPVIIFTVITSTIGGLQLFTEPQVLIGDGGGPGGGGMTIVLYLYRQAFVKHSFGYAATISWGLFFIIAVFSIINWLVVRRQAD